MLARSPSSRRKSVAVVAVFQSPSLTQERYEESVRKVTGGKSRVDSPADWPVEGLLAHISGQGPSGFRVVDVWESEDAFNRFASDRLMPKLQELGIGSDQPDVQFHDAHAYFAPKPVRA
jgi:hypothetical protein